MLYAIAICTGYVVVVTSSFMQTRGPKNQIRWNTIALDLITNPISRSSFATYFKKYLGLINLTLN